MRKKLIVMARGHPVSINGVRVPQNTFIFYVRSTVNKK